MTSNLTRFYLEPSLDTLHAESGLAFEDVETIEADTYEESLRQQCIEYIRIDL
jgi:hypothetical protein